MKKHTESCDEIRQGNSRNSGITKVLDSLWRHNPESCDETRRGSSRNNGITKVLDSTLRHNPYVGTFIRCRSNLNKKTVKNSQGTETKHIGWLGTFRHSPPSETLFETKGILDVLVGSNEDDKQQSLEVVTPTSSVSNQLKHLTRCELRNIPIIVYGVGEKEEEEEDKRKEESHEHIIRPDASNPKRSAEHLCKSATSLTCCVICFEDFVQGEKLRVLRCGHAYHRKCIDRWLLGTLTLSETITTQCPLCKTDALSLRKQSCECCYRYDCKACGIPEWTYLKLGASLLGNSSSRGRIRERGSND